MARIGVTGLGTMGAALALNMADRGFDVAVHNRTDHVVDDFMSHAGDLADRFTPAKSLEDLVAALEPPRAVLIMVKAGDPVDKVIDALLPLLGEGDLIIDAGNADFNDTRRRTAHVTALGKGFLGIGVSGGEEGARHGPSIMVGGTKALYQPIEDIVEAIAAKYQGHPCAAWLGPDGAGHFVKTVHNGIEYADMQFIAEVFGILQAEGRSYGEMAGLFKDWNGGPLQSYLVEIMAEILAATDTETGRPIVDVIVDKAGQKGTGRWTVIEALKLGQSATAIEAAVAARSWSAEKEARSAAEAAYPVSRSQLDRILDTDLEEALLAARIIGYGQGLALLNAASEHYDWDLDLARIAEIWRAGCIIRSSLLDDIATAARAGMPHGQLILAPGVVPRLREAIPALRRVVAAAMAASVPVPGLASALGYFDTFRRGRGTTNMVQAQRDFFGRHGFERTDRDGGGFHGPWAD